MRILSTGNDDKIKLFGLAEATTAEATREKIEKIFGEYCVNKCF